jgi:hypothetical protein
MHFYLFGTLQGVAKQSRVHGVRVLDCNGVGDTSTVIAGLQFVLNERARLPSKICK